MCIQNQTLHMSSFTDKRWVSRVCQSVFARAGVLFKTETGVAARFVTTQHGDTDLDISVLVRDFNIAIEN